MSILYNFNAYFALYAVCILDVQRSCFIFIRYEHGRVLLLGRPKQAERTGKNIQFHGGAGDGEFFFFKRGPIIMKQAYFFTHDSFGLNSLIFLFSQSHFLNFTSAWAST